MANEDLKFNNILGMSASSGTVSNSTSNAAITHNTNIENIFKAFEEFAKKRGVAISTEDFQRVVNMHPEIFELPPEEQAVKWVQILANSQESTEVKQKGDELKTPSGFQLSEEEQLQLIQAIQFPENNDVTLELVEPEAETKNIQDANNIETEIKSLPKDPKNLILKKMGISLLEEYQQTVNENNIGSSYDTNKFSKLSYQEQVAEYKREYAKNRYLNDPNEKHTTEDWVKLGNEEQRRIIESYSKEVDQAIKSGEILVKKILNSVDNKSNVHNSEAVIELLMLQLQAANESSSCPSVKDFKNFNEFEQLMFIASMLDTKSKIGSDTAKLTKLEDYILEKANFVKSAINAYAKNHNITDEEICFEDIPVYIATNGENVFGAKAKRIPIATALKEHLESIENPTATQKEVLNFLSSVKSDYLETFGLKYGMDSLLTFDVKSDEKYKTLYENAKSDKERAEVKINYFIEKFKDTQDFESKIQEYAKSAIECADISEIMAFYSAAHKNEAISKALGSAMKDIFVVNTSQIDKLGVAGGQLVLDNLSGLTKTDQKKAKELGKQAIAQSSNGQFYELRDNYAKLTNFINGLGEDFVNKVCQQDNPNKQRGLIDSAIASGADELKNEFIIKAPKLHKNNQVYTLKRCTDGSVERTQLAISSGVVPKLHADNQVEGASLLQERAETLMTKEVALRNLKSLANQIQDCDASNQAAMHKNITNGKYEEVAVYAAANIYKYDKSVQAEALSISYATGNVAIIEAANLQVVYMNEAAVVAMKEQISAQIQAMEERHTAALVDEFATRQVKKELGFDVDTNKPEYKTRMEAYIAELKSLPKSELYKKIINDMQSWPATMQAMFLEAIVKYCPQLFAMMLDTFGAKLLFAFGQVNSATKNEILMQMLKTPTKRSEAIAYIKSNPNGNYSDKLKKLYDEIIDDLIASGQIVEDAVPKQLSTGKPREEINYTRGMSTIEAIGQNYNLDTKTDIYGNTWIIS